MDDDEILHQLVSSWDLILRSAETDTPKRTCLSSTISFKKIRLDPQVEMAALFFQR